MASLSPSLPGDVPPQVDQKACVNTPVPSPENNGGSLRVYREKRRAWRTVNPDIGSLYHIMQENPRTPLLVAPICWTDRHVEALGVRFSEVGHISKPIPLPLTAPVATPQGRAVQANLETLIDPKRNIPNKARAIKDVVALFFPEATKKTRTWTQLNLYFGERVYPEQIRLPIAWRSKRYMGSSFDSAKTLPLSARDLAVGDTLTGPTCPVLAYLNKGYMRQVRETLFRVARNPSGGDNAPVRRLAALRSKLLIPANTEHDPYVIAILLAMAQASVYRIEKRLSGASEEPASSCSNNHLSSNRKEKPVTIHSPRFRDVRVQLMTTCDEKAELFIYTACFTANYLRRFARPWRVPPGMTDGELRAGVHIQCTRLDLFPIIGLRERLCQILIPEISGNDRLAVFGDHFIDKYWYDMLIELPFSSVPLTAEPVFHAKRKYMDVYADDERAWVARTADDHGKLSSANSGDDKKPDHDAENVTLHNPAAKRRRVDSMTPPLEVF